MAEKTINEISRDARELYKKAQEAAQRDNTDYAIALFNQMLEKEPAFYDGRKALRTEQFKKAGSGGGFFKKMMSSAGSSPLWLPRRNSLCAQPGRVIGQPASKILNSGPAWFEQVIKLLSRPPNPWNYHALPFCLTKRSLKIRLRRQRLWSIEFYAAGSRRSRACQPGRTRLSAT